MREVGGGGRIFLKTHCIIILQEQSNDKREQVGGRGGTLTLGVFLGDGYVTIRGPSLGRSIDAHPLFAARKVDSGLQERNI